MANARLEIRIGNLEFIGEGEQDWLTSQLDKMIERLPDLIDGSKVPSVKVESSSDVKQEVPNIAPTLFSANQNFTGRSNSATENLSTFLRKRDAVDKQRRKFLGTAVWLQQGGKQLIKTKESYSCFACC